MEFNQNIRHDVGDLCIYTTKDKKGEIVKRTGAIIMLGTPVCRVLPSGCKRAILVPTNNIVG